LSERWYFAKKKKKKKWYESLSKLQRMTVRSAQAAHEQQPSWRPAKKKMVKKNHHCVEE